MTAATVSRWARRYVLASAGFLVSWQALALAAGLGALPWVGRRAAVVLGLHGFVLHVLFGKAYSLVPTYFDRDLALPRAPGVQFPLVVVGTLGLAAGAMDRGPPWLPAAGALAWALGVAVFVGALGWTVRDNLTGHETATGEAKDERRPVDRLANAAVPVALGYLMAGTVATLAMHRDVALLAELPDAVPALGYPPVATHLLAAGTAGLMVFGVGFRLLPRFTVASVPRWLVASVLATGALGPALLAAGVAGGGGLFHAGATLEAMAVGGFAVAVTALVARATRRRVGLYSVLAGAGSGALAVALGLSFAFGGRPAALVTAHYRLTLLGFLGLTIVGVAFQFYPPAAGRWPGAGDRTALGVIAALGGGLWLQVGGLAAGRSVVVTAGQVATLAGALGYAYVLLAVFATQRSR